MGRHRNSPSSRSTVRLNHLNDFAERVREHEDALNEDLQQKVVMALAEYHRTHIATPMTGASVEERLWLVERLSMKWWIAAGILWLRNRYRLWRALRADKHVDGGGEGA